MHKFFLPLAHVIFEICQVLIFPDVASLDCLNIAFSSPDALRPCIVKFNLISYRVMRFIWQLKLKTCLKTAQKVKKDLTEAQRY